MNEHTSQHSVQDTDAGNDILVSLPNQAAKLITATSGEDSNPSGEYISLPLTPGLSTTDPAPSSQSASIITCRSPRISLPSDLRPPATPPPASPPPASSPQASSPQASPPPASFRTGSPGVQQPINLAAHRLPPNGSSVAIPLQTPSNTSTGKGFLTYSVLSTAICALGLFIFITLVTWKSASLDWPLANLSITSGILLLSFVSKFIDWALEMLSDVGWEKLYWGWLLQRSGGNLLTFLVVNSGLNAWLKALVYAPKQSSRSSLRLVTLSKRQLLARWPQFWAFWRQGWNTTFEKSIFWADKECRVYGSASNAVQICAKESNKGGSILTGIRACDPGQLDDTGDCTLNPDWPGWDSFVAFSSTLDIHRLNTSIAADRRSSAILDVLDKGEAHRQKIESTNFLDAFDNLLCPFNPDNSSTTSRYCEIGQARSDLTNSLWSVIYSNYNVGAMESSLAVETLRNLFATALFLFNPVYRGAVLTSEPVFSRTTQAGLADENYFPGSAARVSSYVAPKPWSVVAFTVSGAFMIFASLAAVCVSLYFKQPTTSTFDPINVFSVKVSEPAQVGSHELGSIQYEGQDREGDHAGSSRAVDRAKGIAKE
ncbi:uncharacterized protein F5Z01DRAFT_617828 [Emericellopsis atlantica]|uniref:Uncharacterized protein n=1 Tax=Emericellopsis atlantica TaxID=2614577 RepID=A0A9P7ZRJ3_9HYPO|nr:uncharacterized protein F5Z01DRAFT_617828 [Emericellopsis atlantica]KAG9256522.1 hypothetical protein F5Z01DRAFT_617828 [Emericellopsis atlantica]